MREKEFHLSYSGRSSTLPLTDFRRRSGACCRAMSAWVTASPARAAAVQAAAPTNRGRPASSANRTAPPAAAAAAAMTAPGPSVVLSR